jgi:hypothetical protein
VTITDAVCASHRRVQAVANTAHKYEPSYADGDFCPVYFLIVRGVGLTTHAHRSASFRVMPKGSQVRVIAPFSNLIETLYLR